MTFTFDPDLGDNISLVRFHCGDTSDAGHFVDDATITYLLADNDNEIGKVVILCIKYILTQLSQPDFSVGWMNVSNAQARDGYENMLVRKAQEFSVSIGGVRQSVTVKNISRSDSYQTSSDYSGGLP